MPIDQRTFDFLRGEWFAAGGPEMAADVAASIAFAESSGCQYALAGPTDIRPKKVCVWRVTSTENSCGYWQVNLYAHKDYSAPSIFDPAVNAAAAVAISNHGTDFGPWSTYTNGAYLKYLRTFGGEKHPPPPPPPPPKTYVDEPTIAPGAWNDGWAHLSHALGHTLASSLVHSQRSRQRTLQQLARSRKVIR